VAFANIANIKNPSTGEWLVNKNLNGAGLSAVLLFVSAMTLSIGGCVPGGNSDADFQQALVDASSQQNKSLPMMVDKDTRWDTTIPGPGKNWTYIYTLINPESSTYTNAQINEVLGGKIRSGVCSMKEMEAFRKNGVIMKYSYRDHSGKFIGEVVVKPEDCK